MLMPNQSRPFSRSKFGSALATITLLALSATAIAGSCPAQHVTTSGQQAGSTEHKNVTDKVLTMIPLAKETVGLKEHSLRLRRLVLQPGGSVAWHGHADRPAIIYIVSAKITEYSSQCAVQIVHSAGQSTAGSDGLVHWWKNHTKSPVVLLSADLLHDHKNNHM
jgi:quercetin dioxygenase-like cupin family protein